MYYNKLLHNNCIICRYHALCSANCRKIYKSQSIKWIKALLEFLKMAPVRFLLCEVMAAQAVVELKTAISLNVFPSTRTGPPGLTNERNKWRHNSSGVRTSRNVSTNLQKPSKSISCKQIIILYSVVNYYFNHQ